MATSLPAACRRLGSGIARPRRWNRHRRRARPARPGIGGGPPCGRCASRGPTDVLLSAIDRRGRVGRRGARPDGRDRARATASGSVGASYRVRARRVEPAIRRRPLASAHLVIRRRRLPPGGPRWRVFGLRPRSRWSSSCCWLPAQAGDAGPGDCRPGSETPVIVAQAVDGPPRRACWSAEVVTGGARPRTSTSSCERRAGGPGSRRVSRSSTSRAPGRRSPGRQPGRRRWYRAGSSSPDCQRPRRPCRRRRRDVLRWLLRDRRYDRASGDRRDTARCSQLGRCDERVR